MRKWWGSGSRGGVLEGMDSVNSPAAQQHLALGLMHLKKLFSEYSYPPHPLSETEKEDKLYNMLPLFCKVILLLFFFLFMNYSNLTYAWNR